MSEMKTTTTAAASFITVVRALIYIRGRIEIDGSVESRCSVPRTPVGLVKHPANNLAANGEVNTVEDLEALWASVPAPIEAPALLAA